MALSTEDVYKLYLQCEGGVTTDTRNSPAGSMFIALKGASFDGNAFAADALSKGCKYAIVDEAKYADGKTTYLVDDCLLMLQHLALLHRRTLGTKMLGITGTNGKTTTKELVSAVLQRKFKILYTQGNLNNQIGVPLTVLGLAKDDQLAVVEMGASHPGDIKMLVDIAEPDFGLITNIGRAHLQGFGSYEGVIKTKGEMYDFIRARGGKVFRNADNPVLTSISAGLDSILYGKSDSNFVHARLVSAAPFLTVEWMGKVINTHLIGDYNFENVMAAITVGTYFGVPEADVIDAIASYVPSNNRSQFKETGKNKLIIDAYNANPTSMAASIKNFVNMDFDNKTLIIGDMRELGADSRKEHQGIVDLISQNGFKQVYLVGDCFAEVATSGMHTFKDVDELIAYVKTNSIEKATVLVKGSNSTHLINVIAYL